MTNKGKENIFVSSHGITLREWFAGMAMQGIIATRDVQSSACYKMDKEWVASEATAFADALLNELEKND